MEMSVSRRESSRNALAQSSEEWPSSARRQTAYHHGNLAQALTTAARAILEEEGLAKLSLRAAARRAGVSQAAPYHHFRDKEALLASVATQGHKDFAAALQAGMERAGPAPGEAWVGCGVAYVEFALQNPGLFRLMFGSAIEHCGAYPALTDAGRASYAVLQQAVSALQTADAAGAELLALDSWSTVHGLATLLIDGGLEPRDVGAEDGTALARALLTARLESLSGVGH